MLRFFSQSEYCNSLAWGIYINTLSSFRNAEIFSSQRFTRQSVILSIALSDTVVGVGKPDVVDFFKMEKLGKAYQYFLLTESFIISRQISHGVSIPTILMGVTTIF